jgi:hypothetical protein
MFSCQKHQIRIRYNYSGSGSDLTKKLTTLLNIPYLEDTVQTSIVIEKKAAEPPSLQTRWIDVYDTVLKVQLGLRPEDVFTLHTL